MSSLTRRLSLLVLLALLAATLPTARVAHAQTFTVNTTDDTDDLSTSCATDCTLRKAIRLANEHAGADTINFSVSGTIKVSSALPALTDGRTSIIASPPHSVVLDGGFMSGSAFGLQIMSPNNVVRGLVIVDFPGSFAFTGGSGISISTAAATNNVIANNWIGLNTDGTTIGNDYYGVQIDDRASNNTIGGTAVGDANVITGNLQANVAVDDSDSSTTAEQYISGNQIIGNYIGTNAAGTAIPGDVKQNELVAGVLVGTYARSTLIKNNVIGGHLGNQSLSNNIAAGVVVISNETASDSARHPQNTTIVGNYIGITPSGANIANHNGISLYGGAINTVIGDKTDPVGGRNIIGFSQADGILLSDNAVNVTGTEIVGNYIGIASDGTTLATIGNTAIYLGTVTSLAPVPATVIGPANVIASARRSGIRVRSSSNTIKGNFIGTNAAGTTTSTTNPTTAGYGFGNSAIWVENGSGNQIGGPNGGERNVIAAGGSGNGSPSAILLMPGGGTTSSCSAPSGGACSVTATTIQGNYLGVSSTGTAALLSPTNLDSEGVRMINNISSGSATTAPSGNTVSGNVISGLGYGIVLREGASNNTLSGNRIGTRASGVLDSSQAIGNRQDGIRLLQGTGNQITNNTIAFNGYDSAAPVYYYGISINNTTGGANGNTLSGNNLVNNGKGSVSRTTNNGIYLNGPTGIKITKTTTRNHNGGDGIRFGASGTNGNIEAPNLTAVGRIGATTTLTGTTGCVSGCTVEVFTTNLSTETKEGPVYLTSGNTTAGGGFSINITGCQRYLTATVRDASDNTSPFSASLDSGGTTGLCVNSTFSLAAAPSPNQLIYQGDTYTYTHSITNNAPVERTFTVVFTSTLGWASAPTQVTVPASSSESFNVVVSVPYTAKVSPTPDIDTTSVQVFAGASGSNVVTDTTTAKAHTNSPAFPTVSPGYTQERSVTTLTTFTHSVANTGDLPGDFSVVGPTFVGTPPDGWSITSATLGQTTLAGGASTTLTIVVNTPDGAPAGSVQFSFKIQTGSTQTSLVTDTITVATVRSFSFSAVAPTTISSPPGASADFVYTLTNTGNMTDNFQITPPTNTTPVAITTFTANPSGSFSLAANTTRIITVTAQIPSGTVTGDYDFSVTAVALDGTPPTALSVDGRITVIGGGAPQLSFSAGSPDPAPASAADGTVTFTGTLTNTGNATAPFSLGTPIIVDSPAWPAAEVVYDGNCTLSPTTISLAANESCTFTLQVTVPADANGGPQEVTLSATVDNSGFVPKPDDVTVNATATVNVAILRDVSLSAANLTPQTGIPGTVLTYTHTLTNLGNATDSFTMTVTPLTPATFGMAVISPTSVTNVPRNGTSTITLVVTVPGGVIAGDLTFTVTATSHGDPSKTASQDDIAKVEAFDAASLSPGTSKNGLPGASVTFTHTLTNTGSTLIAYEIATSNSQAGVGFTSNVSGSPTIELVPGMTTTITVEVKLPVGVLGGTANITTVEVRKVGGTEVLASATDESLVGNTYDVQITPDRSGKGYPNETLVFTHTVTNIGITADTYSITAVNALAWRMGVSNDLITLGPGQSQVITVSIDVPNDDSTQVDTKNFGRISVTSNTNPDTSHDEAVENISVGKVINLVFSTDQSRAVTPSSGRFQMNDLVISNIGNASDIIDFNVLGADGGWSVDIMPYDILGPRDTNYNVGIWVTVPKNVEPGPIKVITIQAQSRSNSDVVADVQLRFAYIAPAVQVSYKTYLPAVRR
ncbi:hypothetical protein EKD04_001115 [Chloroflexales bacterium ZM16-3]|nr:hypothetical protein [Chloroflexales bacterium ZM16-3]